MTKFTQEQIQAIIDEFKNRFPVKVGAIAEKLELSIVSTDELPPNTSGSLVKEENGTYTIYVNKYDSILHQRFTIAHEIAHFVKHHHREYLNEFGEILNARKTLFNHTRTADAETDTKLEDAYNNIEQEADAFAGDLLMPKEQFTEVWQSAQTLKEVADKFGVSEMDANLRAAALGLGVFR